MEKYYVIDTSKGFFDGTLFDFRFGKAFHFDSKEVAEDKANELKKFVNGVRVCRYYDRLSEQKEAFDKIINAIKDKKDYVPITCKGAIYISTIHKVKYVDDNTISVYATTPYSQAHYTINKDKLSDMNVEVLHIAKALKV